MYIHIYMYISIYVYTYIYNYLLVYTCSSFMGSIFTATDDPVFAALTSLWLFWIDKSSVSEKVLCRGACSGRCVCVCVYSKSSSMAWVCIFAALISLWLLWIDKSRGGIYIYIYIYMCVYIYVYVYVCMYYESTIVEWQRKSCWRGLVCKGVCVYMYIYYVGVHVHISRRFLHRKRCYRTHETFWHPIYLLCSRRCVGCDKTHTLPR